VEETTEEEKKGEVLLMVKKERVIGIKNKNIEKYINTKAPWYKHLLEYKRKELNKINPKIKNEEDLDIELYKIKRKFELELKRETEELLKEWR